MKNKKLLTYIIIIMLALFLGIIDNAEELEGSTYPVSEALPNPATNDDLNNPIQKEDPIGISDTIYSKGNSAAGEPDTFTDGTVNESSNLIPEATGQRGPYKVNRVVDGDTIILDIDGTNERVRLIGIDAPESVHPDAERNVEYGKISSAYTTSMLDEHDVYIELDVEERDQYGRLLAYVYLDGTMFNKLLLQKGHAVVSTYPPNVKYVDDLTALQEEARENGDGLWNQNN